MRQSTPRTPGLSRRALLELVLSSVSLTVLAACRSAAAPAGATTAAGATTPAGASTAAGATAPAGASTAAVGTAPAGGTVPAGVTTPAGGTAAAAPTAAGVSAPTGGATAAGVSTAVAAAPQAVSGGTLRVSRLGDIARLDGHLTTAADTTWIPFDRLSAYDASLQPQPMLAESWDISPDYRQIKLSLRPGVQYHSGREFTSDDVKWNLLRVRDPKAGAGALTNQSNWFTSIDTPDKYTVVLGSDQPRPFVFDMFEYFNMLDHVSMEGPDALKTLVGTGPFTFVEWAQGDHLTFAKNPSYWRPGRPFVDTLQVTIAKDPQSGVLQLESGALDMVLSVPLRDYTRLQSDPAYQAVLVPGVIHVHGVNVLNAPMNDKRVRQALNYAIDRKRFTDTTLLGTAAPLCLPWLPGSVADDPTRQSFYTYDPDKARSLLNQAGVSGVTFDALYSPSYPELYDFAQVYQADLAELGLTLNIMNLDQAAWLDQVNNRKYTGLYGSVVNYATLEPVTIISNSRHYDPSGNNTGFTSDQYTQLFNAAAVEPDLTKRKQIYGQLSDLLLDESFAMPMAPASTRVIARSTVHGLTTSQHNALLYNDTWISGGA